MAEATVHVWKTTDGRLVLAEDPDAAILAYAPGDEVQAKDAEAVSALLKGEPTPEPKGQEGEDAKQVEKPADKAAKRQADK